MKIVQLPFKSESESHNLQSWAVIERNNTL